MLALKFSNMLLYEAYQKKSTEHEGRELLWNISLTGLTRQVFSRKHVLYFIVLLISCRTKHNICKIIEIKKQKNNFHVLKGQKNVCKTAVKHHT